MKKIIPILVILSILPASCVFAQLFGGQSDNLTGLHLYLKPEVFLGKTEQDTISNIEAFINEVRKIRGLNNIRIHYIIDKNLRRSLIVSKKDYKEYWDREVVGEVKKELESDGLVQQIWVGYDNITIKFKAKVYYEAIQSFLKRHPGLSDAASLTKNKLKDIDVYIDGVPEKKARDYKKLLEDKFSSQIQKVELLTP